MSSRVLEHRKHPRIDIERDVKFFFSYDFQTELTLKSAKNTYQYGRSVNISLEGLCFRSLFETPVGSDVTIYVYLPKDKHPVIVDGTIRWTHEISDLNQVEYESGVLISQIDGQSVQDTVHYDEKYDVYWSNVLESILGRYRIQQFNTKQD